MFCVYCCGDCNAPHQPPARVHRRRILRLPLITYCCAAALNISPVLHTPLQVPRWSLVKLLAPRRRYAACGFTIVVVWFATADCSLLAHLGERSAFHTQHLVSDELSLSQCTFIGKNISPLLMATRLAHALQQVTRELQNCLTFITRDYPAIEETAVELRCMPHLVLHVWLKRSSSVASQSMPTAGLARRC